MEELTLAEENYLKAIYHLSGGGSEHVNTNSIADRLKTKPASVSDMIRKLADKGTIDYVKYQGVQITEGGKSTALQVIRKHRLWEVFLVDKLGFHWDEVHEIAEQLEHIRSPLLISRLDEFLGFPKFDPHGDPIPDEFGVISSKPRIILSTLPNGTTCTLVSMRDTGSSFLNYLDRIQLPIGSEIRIQAIMEFDNSVEIMVNGSRSITVSKQVADNLLVVKK